MYTEKFEKKSVEKTTMVNADDGIDSKSTIHNSVDNDLLNSDRITQSTNSDRITQSTNSDRITQSTNLDIESTENHTCK
jgi:hypothetical protein